MRIAFVTSKINFESAGGSVPDLDLKVRDMQALGLDVTVITVFSELNVPAAVPYPIIEEHIRPKTLPNIHWRVFKILRKHEQQFDAYHIEGQFSYGAALYRLFGGKPVVAFYNRETLAWSTGGTMRRLIRHYIEKLLNALLTPHIDHFIFTTPHLQKRYARFGLRLKETAFTIQPDYIDEKKLQPVKHPDRREDVRIVASGRMIPEKGFSIIIDALSLLDAKTREKISTTISGDGPERSELLRRAKERGVEVNFPGWVKKDMLYKLLADTDIFILPKWHIELSSVILLEAMSLGLACIVPRGGGLEWLARDGAETFEQDDPASLSAAIRLLTDSEKRNQRSSAAIERMREFRHQKMASVLYTILTTVR